MFYSGGRRSRSASRRGTVRGYTIRGRYGLIKYVGVTNNPARRAQEHRHSGKRGTLRVETGGMSRSSARKWSESASLHIVATITAGILPTIGLGMADRIHRSRQFEQIKDKGNYIRAT